MRVDKTRINRAILLPRSRFRVAQSGLEATSRWPRGGLGSGGWKMADFGKIGRHARGIRPFGGASLRTPG